MILDLCNGVLHFKHSSLATLTPNNHTFGTHEFEKTGYLSFFVHRQGDHTKSQQPHHLTALTVYDTEEIKKKALKTSLPDLKTN